MTTIRTSLLYDAIQGCYDLDEAITAIIEDCYVPDPAAHSNRVEAMFNAMAKRWNIPLDSAVRLDWSERADRIWAANAAANEGKS